MSFAVRFSRISRGNRWPRLIQLKRGALGEGELSERFAARLIQCRAGLSGGKAVEGEIVAGGFGTGKSHLLGFLADQALRENFIVSPVAISKETPLFDPERL